MIFRRAIPMVLWSVLLFFFYKVLRLPLFDSDLWWHLASGRYMVEHHQILKTDVFSYTLGGTRWINFEWLSQIILYRLVHVFGLKAVLYGKVVLGLIVIGSLILLFSQLGAAGPALPFLALIGFLVLRQRLYERVELVTLIFLPLLIILLLFVRDRPPHKSSFVGPTIFVLMVAWCNLHGGFIYAIGLAVLLELGARWSEYPSTVVRRFDRLLLIMALSVLINPYGPRIAEVFIEHWRQLSLAPQIIEEWLPPTIRQTPYFWALFVATGTALVWGIFNRSRAARFWGPAVLVFSVWGARHTRNSVYMAYVALPFLIEFAKEDGSLLVLIREHWVRPVGWTIVAIFLLILYPVWHRPIPAPLLMENNLPVGACRFLETNNIQGTLFNTYQFGGYIEWASEKRPVFMDGRYIFQPLLVAHARMDSDLTHNPDGAAWQKYLASYGVDYAVIDYGTNLYPSEGKTPFPFAWANMALPRSQWALVYWDDAALIFLKRKPAFNGLISKYAYNEVWPYNLDQMKALLATGELSTAAIRTEIERHKREVGFSVVRQQIEDLITKEMPAHVG